MLIVKEYQQTLALKKLAVHILDCSVDAVNCSKTLIASNLVNLDRKRRKDLETELAEVEGNTVEVIDSDSKVLGKWLMLMTSSLGLSRIQFGSIQSRHRVLVLVRSGKDLHNYSSKKLILGKQVVVEMKVRLVKRFVVQRQIHEPLVVTNEDER